MMLLRILVEILCYSFGVKTTGGAEHRRGDEGREESKKKYESNIRTSIHSWCLFLLHKKRMDW